jgi:hypothetical protein
MSLESSQTSTLVLAIVAILVVFQTILLIAIAVSLAKISKSFDELTADARAFLGVAKRCVERMEPRMIEITQTVQHRLRQADHMTIELLAKSKAHALAIDTLIRDLLRTAEYANHQIEQTTSRAFREVHALHAGLRAALSYLFSRHRSGASQRDPGHPT